MTQEERRFLFMFKRKDLPEEAYKCLHVTELNS